MQQDKVKPKYRIYHYEPWLGFPEQYDYALITNSNKHLIDRCSVLKSAFVLFYNKLIKGKFEMKRYK